MTEYPTASEGGTRPIKYPAHKIMAIKILSAKVKAQYLRPLGFKCFLPVFCPFAQSREGSFFSSFRQKKL